MRTTIVLATLLLFVLACGSDGGATSEDAAAEGNMAPDTQEVVGPLVVETTDGGWLLRSSGADASASLLLQAEPFELRLHRAEAAEDARLVLPTFGFGTVPERNDEINYDPYWYYRDITAAPVDTPPAGFARTWVTKILELSEQGGLATARLETDDGHQLDMRVAVLDDASFTLSFSAPQGEPGLNDVITSYLEWPMAEGEDFYGTGERFDTAALRGSFRAMQFEAVASESAYNEAHVPVPLAVSTRAYGVFVDELRPGILDFGTIDAERARLEFAHDALTVHLLTAPSPLEVLTPYVELTGKPNMPSWWAFAPQQWRNVVNGSEEVLDDAAQARAHQIPVGVIWIDRPWEQSYHDLTFDPGMFPDPQGMLDSLRDQGYRVVTWTAPYQTPASDVWDECVEKDLFVKRPAGWPSASYSAEVELMDFTNPAAQDLWVDLIHRVTDMGVEGFKLDYGEDVQVGIATKRTIFGFFNGEDERTMHHRYQAFWHEIFRRIMGPDNGFIMARSGLPRDQVNTNAIWPGDLNNDFSYFRELVDGKKRVGGLPAAIRASLSLGASGFPYFASDTGGFRDGRPTKEVLLRWVQHTALTAILQFGGGGDTHNPWDFEGKGDEPKYDQETLDIFRVYADLHIQLFPYLYTFALRAQETGVPIQRPLGLVEADGGRHPSDQYFFGDALYVAPVERAETTKDVAMPAGTWFDWWDDAAYQGAKTHEVDAPLAKLPLFARQGAIVPMLSPGVQTLSDKPELSHLAPAAYDGSLQVRVVTGAEGAFDAYDGSRFVYEETLGDGAQTLRLVFTPGSVFKHANLEFVTTAAGIDAPVFSLIPNEGDPLILPDVGADMHAWKGCSEGCVARLDTTGRWLVHVPSTVSGYTLVISED